ncbi:hypothetical protein [Rhizobium sp. BK060]|uniref:hypothetical protein n=1 Tax=Rhizobium sp. BK060 TaxID=2587096 RepID=UPI00184421ED|nr:hypothetical protein [Rhizobium sp. BK060]MBB3393577.1 DNA polymerase III delta subunit [Rhizobium sp. BK060]
MLETIANSGHDFPVHYVHGAENGRVHATISHVRDIAKDWKSFRTAIFYGNPHVRDERGIYFDHDGYITVD